MSAWGIATSLFQGLGRPSGSGPSASSIPTTSAGFSGVLAARSAASSDSMHVARRQSQEATQATAFDEANPFGRASAFRNLAAKGVTSGSDGHVATHEPTGKAHSVNSAREAALAAVSVSASSLSYQPPEHGLAVPRLAEVGTERLELREENCINGSAVNGPRSQSVIGEKAAPRSWSDAGGALSKSGTETLVRVSAQSVGSSSTASGGRALSFRAEAVASLAMTNVTAWLVGDRVTLSVRMSGLARDKESEVAAVLRDVVSSNGHRTGPIVTNGHLAGFPRS